eukprot:m.233734 g.233734  ORF g.233734 m.233734 type:complete len:3673 (+) comp10882_c0_seq5:3-11021(+)
MTGVLRPLLDKLDQNLVDHQERRQLLLHMFKELQHFRDRNQPSKILRSALNRLLVILHALSHHLIGMNILSLEPPTLVVLPSSPESLEDCLSTLQELQKMDSSSFPDQQQLVQALQLHIARVNLACHLREKRPSHPVFQSRHWQRYVSETEPLLNSFRQSRSSAMATLSAIHHCNAVTRDDARTPCTLSLVSALCQTLLASRTSELIEILGYMKPEASVTGFLSLLDPLGSTLSAAEQRLVEHVFSEAEEPSIESVKAGDIFESDWIQLFLQLEQLLSAGDIDERWVDDASAALRKLCELVFGRQIALPAFLRVLPRIVDDRENLELSFFGYACLNVSKLLPRTVFWNEGFALMHKSHELQKAAFEKWAQIVHEGNTPEILRLFVELYQLKICSLPSNSQFDDNEELLRLCDELKFLLPDEQSLQLKLKTELSLPVASKSEQLKFFGNKCFHLMQKIRAVLQDDPSDYTLREAVSCYHEIFNHMERYNVDRWWTVEQQVLLRVIDTYNSKVLTMRTGNQSRKRMLLKHSPHSLRFYVDGSFLEIQPTGRSYRTTLQTRNSSRTAIGPRSTPHFPGGSYVRSDGIIGSLAGSSTPLATPNVLFNAVQTEVEVMIEQMLFLLPANAANPQNSQNFATDWYEVRDRFNEQRSGIRQERVIMQCCNQAGRVLTSCHEHIDRLKTEINEGSPLSQFQRTKLGDASAELRKADKILADLLEPFSTALNEFRDRTQQCRDINNACRALGSAAQSMASSRDLEALTTLENAFQQILPQNQKVYIAHHCREVLVTEAKVCRTWSDTIASVDQEAQRFTASRDMALQHLELERAKQPIVIELEEQAAETHLPESNPFHDQDSGSDSGDDEEDESIPDSSLTCVSVPFEPLVVCGPTPSVVIRKITLRNPQDSPIDFSIRAVSAPGINNDCFLHNFATGQGQIPLGSEDTLEFKFRPLTLGLVKGHYEVVWSTVDEHHSGTVALRLFASGLPAVLQLSKQSIEMHQSLLDAPRAVHDTIELENLSHLPLYIGVQLASDELELEMGQERATEKKLFMAPKDKVSLELAASLEVMQRCGTFSGTLRLFLDPHNEAQMHAIPISLHVHGPQLRYAVFDREGNSIPQTKSITLPDQSLGDWTTVVLAVANVGDEPLTVDLSKRHQPTEIRIDEEHFVIEPRDQRLIRLEIGREKPGMFASLFTLAIEKMIETGIQMVTNDVLVGHQAIDFKVSLRTSIPELVKTSDNVTANYNFDLKRLDSMEHQVKMKNTGNSKAAITAVRVAEPSLCVVELLEPCVPFSRNSTWTARLEVNFLTNASCTVTLLFDTNSSIVPTLTYKLDVTGRRPELFIPRPVVNLGLCTPGTISLQVPLKNIGELPLTVTLDKCDSNGTLKYKKAAQLAGFAEQDQVVLRCSERSPKSAIASAAFAPAQMTVPQNTEQTVTLEIVVADAAWSALLGRLWPSTESLSFRLELQLDTNEPSRPAGSPPPSIAVFGVCVPPLQILPVVPTAQPIQISLLLQELRSNRQRYPWAEGLANALPRPIPGAVSTDTVESLSQMDELLLRPALYHSEEGLATLLSAGQHPALILGLSELGRADLQRSKPVLQIVHGVATGLRMQGLSPCQQQLDEIFEHQPTHALDGLTLAIASMPAEQKQLWISLDIQLRKGDMDISSNLANFAGVLQLKDPRCHARSEVEMLSACVTHLSEFSSQDVSALEHLIQRLSCAESLSDAELASICGEDYVPPDINSLVALAKSIEQDLDREVRFELDSERWIWTILKTMIKRFSEEMEATDKAIPAAFADIVLNRFLSHEDKSRASGIFGIITFPLRFCDQSAHEQLLASFDSYIQEIGADGQPTSPKLCESSARFALNFFVTKQEAIRAKHFRQLQHALHSALVYNLFYQASPPSQGQVVEFLQLVSDACLKLIPHKATHRARFRSTMADLLAGRHVDINVLCASTILHKAYSLFKDAFGWAKVYHGVRFIANLLKALSCAPQKSIWETIDDSVHSSFRLPVFWIALFELICSSKSISLRKEYLRPTASLPVLALHLGKAMMHVSTPCDKLDALLLPQAAKVRTRTVRKGIKHLLSLCQVHQHVDEFSFLVPELWKSSLSNLVEFFKAELVVTPVYTQVRTFCASNQMREALRLLQTKYDQIGEVLHLYGETAELIASFDKKCSQTTLVALVGEDLQARQHLCSLMCALRASRSCESQDMTPLSKAALALALRVQATPMQENQASVPEQLKPHLECPVCLDFFRDPIVVNGQAFCRACIVSVQRTGGRNPITREKLPEHLEKIPTTVLIQGLVEEHLQQSEMERFIRNPFADGRLSRAFTPRAKSDSNGSESAEAANLLKEDAVVAGQDPEEADVESEFEIIPPTNLLLMPAETAAKPAPASEVSDKDDSCFVTVAASGEIMVSNEPIEGLDTTPSEVAGSTQVLDQGQLRSRIEALQACTDSCMQNLMVMLDKRLNARSCFVTARLLSEGATEFEACFGLLAQVSIPELREKVRVDTWKQLFEVGLKLLSAARCLLALSEEAHPDVLAVLEGSLSQTWLSLERSCLSHVPRHLSEHNLKQLAKIRDSLRLQLPSLHESAFPWLNSVTKSGASVRDRESPVPAVQESKKQLHKFSETPMRADRPAIASAKAHLRAAERKSRRPRPISQRSNGDDDDIDEFDTAPNRFGILSSSPSKTDPGDMLNVRDLADNFVFSEEDMRFATQGRHAVGDHVLNQSIGSKTEVAVGESTSSVPGPSDPLAGTTLATVPKELLKRMKDRFKTLTSNKPPRVSDVADEDAVVLDAETIQERVLEGSIDRTMYAQIVNLHESIIARVTHELASCFAEFAAGNREVCLEIAIAIDNSLSMSGELGHSAQQTLVVLLEAMRRLEQPVSVLSFAGTGKTRLLKKFGRAMTTEMGEEVLLRLNFDQPGTAIAEALQGAHKQLQQARQNRQRTQVYQQCVLLITDGLSGHAAAAAGSQSALQRVTHEVTKNGVSVLAIELLTEHEGPEKTPLRDSIEFGNGQVASVLPSDIKKLHSDIPQMLGKIVRQKLEAIGKAEQKEVPDWVAKTVRSVYDEETPLIWPEEGDVWLQPYEPDNKTPPFVSAFVAPELRVKLKPLLSSKSLLNLCRRHKLAVKQALSEANQLAAQQWWKDTARQYSYLSAQIVNELRDRLPERAARRKKAGFLSGKSINPEKLMQCRAMKFTKHNYWERQVPDGRPAYRFGIALDTSASMHQGSRAFFSAQAFVTLAELFESFETTDTLLYTFGSSPMVLLKDPEQPLDASVKGTCAAHLATTGFDEVGSQQGAAIMAGVDMLVHAAKNSPVACHSTLFVITDDSQDSLVRVAQSYGQQNDVDVVQIVMGKAATLPQFRCFSRVLEAESPAQLLRVLPRYFEHASSAIPDHSSRPRAPMRPLLDPDDAAFVIACEVLARGSPMQLKLAEQAENEQVQFELRQYGAFFTIEVDLVVVLDCTYSMDNWIEAAKSHCHGIIEHVQKEVQRRFNTEAKVQLGFVAFRDFSDGDDLFDAMPLTDDIDAIRAKIATQEAKGGGDYPEDPLTGLEIAADFAWRKNASKMLVLVTDAPQHGPSFTPDDMQDNFPDEPPSTHRMHGVSHEDRAAIVCQRLQNAGIRLVFTHISGASILFEERLQEFMTQSDPAYADLYSTISLGEEHEAFGAAINEQLVLMINELG